MKIICVGDSWGCGEWTKDFFDDNPTNAPNLIWQPQLQKYALSSIIPDTSCSYYLTQMGHEVDNYSIGGDSNLNQLEILEDKLSENSNYDYIIWFFTEPVRDFLIGNLPQFDSKLLDSKLGYDSLVEDWFKVIYGRAQSIYEKYNIKFIVIGGCEKLHDCINNYDFVEFKLDDWTNEMIYENKLFHPHNFAQFDKLVAAYEHVINPAWATEELAICLKYVQTMFSHPSFPDWGHPDRHCHEHLAKWIVDNLN